MLSNDMILDQGFEENASLANNVCNVCLLLCLCKLLHPTDEAIIPYEFHVPESCVHQVCIRLMHVHAHQLFYITQLCSTQCTIHDP